MPPDWLQSARKTLATTQLGPRAQQLGRVEEIGDGVAMISGLHEVRLDEVLHFAGGQTGFARVLEPGLIGAVLLDGASEVQAGDAVQGSGAGVSVPVGEALLGRVIDPLGRPLDGKGPIEAAAHWPIERPAPSIIDRDLVTEPVQTGVLVVDTLFALGRGQRELIVIDDLTKHATTHREIALLTRQSPGREAYPGDVFYIHARLLERAAKLSPERGGGSLTALPIAETVAGNLSAYIPTNLISITDGQIVLDAALFHQGQKPAVDVGLSVSRVGGKTQAPALRQDQHSPLRLADEVALMLALQAGLLDPLSLPAIAAFRNAFPTAIETTEAFALIESGQALSDTARTALLETLTQLAP